MLCVLLLLQSRAHGHAASWLKRLVLQAASYSTDVGPLHLSAAAGVQQHTQSNRTQLSKCPTEAEVQDCESEAPLGIGG